jgi:DNA-binding MarR family transcriptional regulator
MTKLDTRFRTAEESPGFMLWKAANLLQRLHTDCLRDLAVTPAQFSLMTCLVYLHQDGPVTASRVIGHTGMDKMMVSDLIKTLTAKGLVKRKDHPEDGRSFLLEPTAKGVKITNAAVREVEAVDEQFFANTKNRERFHADLVALVRAYG